MINTFSSLIFVYFFILLGYSAKRLFHEEVNSKSLTILSVYFFQPFVTVWGFSTASLDMDHALVPLLYLGIITLLLLPTLLFSRVLFSDSKERAIFSIAGFVGNTGNIGIPLGLVLFGEESLIYTTLINIANVFVVYIIGVYIYSRGSLSIKESLINIIKIPIIPVSIVAIIVNLYGVPIAPQVQEFFKMGAYTGIVLQLFLLGTFLQGIIISSISIRLFLGVIFQKFMLIPIVSATLLYYTNLSLFVQGIIVMEMMTPLAVANINLASLYECRPKDVTILILLSTLVFVPILFLLDEVINFYYLA